MGQISVNIIDNIMVGGLGGKYNNIEDEVLGKTALAAASLGNSLFFAVLVFAFGFSFALSPLIAAEDSSLPVFDTTQIHADTAAEKAMTV